MLELEIQKLTTAIEALTKAVQESARPTVVGNSETPTNLDNFQRNGMAEEANYAAWKKVFGTPEQKLEGEKWLENHPEYFVNLKMLHKSMETEKETSTNLDKPRQKKPKVTKEEVEALVEAAIPVENPVVTDQPLKDKVEEIVSAITAEDLKTVAMEIARSDSSARPLILSILSLHGAKTITQLDPKHYQEVHAELMSIAYDIAKNGEVA